MKDIAPLTERKCRFLGKRGHFEAIFDDTFPTQDFLAALIMRLPKRGQRVCYAAGSQESNLSLFHRPTQFSRHNMMPKPMLVNVSILPQIHRHTSRALCLIPNKASSLFNRLLPF